MRQDINAFKTRLLRTVHRVRQRLRLRLMEVICYIALYDILTQFNSDNNYIFERFEQIYDEFTKETVLLQSYRVND